MIKGYLANSLFSEADQFFNKNLAQRLRNKIPALQLHVPQENEAINDKNSYANSGMIASGDDSCIWDSDFIIAVLDGEVIDPGVACEIGMASTINEFAKRAGGKGVPIFGLFTDVRQNGRDNQKKINALVDDATENQFPYLNLYVVGKIKNAGGNISSSTDELVERIESHFESELKQEDVEEVIQSINNSYK